MMVFEVLAKWPTVERNWASHRLKWQLAVDPGAWLMVTVAFLILDPGMCAPMHQEYSNGTGRENFGKTPPRK